MDIRLKCNCGIVRGNVRDVSPHTGTRTVCYCDDCQAFARFLGHEDEILDKYGGTEVFQTTPAQIEISQGNDRLCCLRLTPKGLYRWYTDCCHTPVANTVAAKVPFASIFHSFMDIAGDREASLGPVRFSVQGKYARGHPPGRTVYPSFPLRLYLHFLPRLLLAALQGKHRPNPFFDEYKRPVSEPAVLTDTR